MSLASLAIAILFLLLVGSLITLYRYRSHIAHMRATQKALQKNIEQVSEQLCAAQAMIKTQHIELDSAKKNAIEINCSNSKLLSNISHEIRTPLNAITGFTQLLLKDELHPRQREYTDIICHASHNLLSIVTNILDFSKIEAEKLILENRPLNIHSLLEEVLTLVSPLAEKKGLQLSALTDLDIPNNFLGDALRLKQIFINLASNAIKFTDSGTITFHLSAERYDTEKALLKITLTDTGIGLSEEEQKVIFSPFSQANESIARRFGGTGLGLSISKNLAEQMGGTLSVESVLGQGASFSLILEMKRSKEQKNYIMSPIAPTEILQPLKILVVDDNPANLKLLCALLADLNVITISCDSGQKAIDYLMRQKVSLILMDIQMPQMNGTEATQHIRAMEKPGEHTPIIAVTAHALEEEKLALFKAGIDDYATKPINDNQLIQLIQKWTGYSVSSSTENILNSAAVIDSSNISSLEPVNLAESLKLANYKKDLANDLLVMLLNGLSKDQIDIQLSWEEENYDQLLEQVHKLHGATRYCGVPLLREATHQAEILIKQKKYTSLPQAIKNISHEINQIYLWVAENHPDHIFYVNPENEKLL